MRRPVRRFPVPLTLTGCAVAAILLISQDRLFGVEIRQSDSSSIILWDFGYLPQKSLVSHEFILRNQMFAPLIIRKIEAGCSCTAATSSDTSIAPGDSTTITVTFNSGRYLGPIKKSTKIYTSDSTRPVQILQIAARVTKGEEATGDVLIYPTKLLAATNSGEGAIQADTLRIKNTAGDELRVEVVSPSAAIIKKIEFPSVIASGNTAELIVYLSRNMQAVKTKGLSLTLYFRNEMTTVVTVPIQFEK